MTGAMYLTLGDARAARDKMNDDCLDSNASFGRYMTYLLVEYINMRECGGLLVNRVKLTRLLIDQGQFEIDACLRRLNVTITASCISCDDCEEFLTHSVHLINGLSS